MTHGVRDLTALFDPRSVAIVGASEDPTRIGGRAVRYLREAGFAGDIYPVNPHRTTVQGLTSYASLSTLPAPPDAALIAVPGELGVEAVEECARLGVRAAIVFSAGYAEVSADGAEAQRRMTEAAQRSGMLLLGPNCLGVLNPANGFYGSFATSFDRAKPQTGKVGVVSQSGAYGAHVAYLATERGIGIRFWITTGNEADVTVSDAISWMAQHEDVDVILAYVEGVTDGDSFVRALQIADTTGTPVVILKAGSSPSGSVAVASHTAALAGSDRVFGAVLTQFGHHRVVSTQEQLDLTYALTRIRHGFGERLGVITVSGGGGIQICDAAERHGLTVPPLDDTTRSSIVAQLSYASARNPVDVTAQSLQQPDLLSHAVRSVLHADVDAIVVYLTTTPSADAPAERLHHAIRDGLGPATDKPVVIVMVGPTHRIVEYEQLGYLVFDDTERAISALSAARSVRGRVTDGARLTASRSPATTLHLPAHVPNEFEAGNLLRTAGLDIAPTLLARTHHDLRNVARIIGYPVVAKICSPDILHKSDVGGVVVGIEDDKELDDVFDLLLERVGGNSPDARIEGVLIAPLIAAGVEMILGVQRDETFGPIVMVGFGGTLVEILDDVVFRRAPFDFPEATRMIGELRTQVLLDGVRGSRAADRNALAEALVTLSEVATTNAETIDSIDLNPVVLLPDRAVALDAVIIPRAQRTPPSPLKGNTE